LIPFFKQNVINYKKKPKNHKVEVAMVDHKEGVPLKDHDTLLREYIAETILKAPNSKYDRRMLMNLDHNDEKNKLNSMFA
jgi:hypothetical protein